MKYLLTVFLILFISCSQDPDASKIINISSLPVVTPDQLIEIEQAGNHFFQHLFYQTLATAEGNVILADWTGQLVVEINPQGKLVRKLAIAGNGPGEIQFLQSLDLNSDELMLFDDSRRRIIKRNLSVSKVEEFEAKNNETMKSLRSYFTFDSNYILLYFWDLTFHNQIEANPRMAFGLMNMKTETIERLIFYPGKTYARYIFGSEIRGATEIPFAADLLYDKSPGDHSLFVFWTEENQIAELDILSFDTLRTIPINLPSENISRAELDSISHIYSEERWNLIQEHLPKEKKPVSNMIVDEQGRIWLQLSRYSGFQEWLILDKDGTTEKIVRFPKGIMVTHISRHHIGVRMDDHIFALYEAV